MIRVVLFEDNKNLRESLGLFLASTDTIWLAGSYPDAREVLHVVKTMNPDVVLMDIQMPHKSGIEAMQEIKQKYPNVKVLIQTVYEDEDKIFQAICSGANGYVIKNPHPDVYVQAIEEVYQGGSHLSPNIAAKVLAMFQNKYVISEPSYIELTQREKQVLACMTKGMSYKMIADNCDIKVGTIHSHIKNIYKKLHVNSAPEAVVKALSMRLV
ncbi:MAG: response regulator transcription factor [Flectobacillus sp.]|nr:response regulator transcription factor [Flectobacillus sp.]